MTEFGVRKFRGILRGCLALTAVGNLVGFCGSALAGHFLGANALAGVALGMPVVSLCAFVSVLLGTGMGITYSLRRGRADTDGADVVFMQAIWTALAVGGALALVIHFGLDHYLAFMHPEAAAAAHAREYWRFLPFAAILMPMSAIFINCSQCDGDSWFVVLASSIMLVVTLAVSAVLLADGRGAAACSFGLIAGYAVNLAVLALHFKSRSNTFRFRARFRLADSFRIIRASIGDASSALCSAFFYLLLGKLIISAFGASGLVYLPVFVFINEIGSVTDAFGVAIQPVITVYFGERNPRMVRAIAEDAIRLGAVFASVVAALFMLAPAAVLSLVALEGSADAKLADAVVRCSAAALPAMAVMSVLNNYYQCIERETLAVIESTALYLVAPLVALGVFAFVGRDYFWWWWPAAKWGGLTVFALVIRFRCGRRSFPLLLDHAREQKIFMFNLRLDELAISRTAEDVGELVRAAGGPGARARLLVEEVLMAIKDHNHARKVYAEVTADFNDGIRLVIRDDGKIFDITDTDGQVSSLRTYLVAALMNRQHHRRNLLTTGYNRNIFRLDAAPQ